MTKSYGSQGGNKTSSLPYDEAVRRFVRLHQVLAELDCRKLSSKTSPSAFDKLLDNNDLTSAMKVLAHWLLYIMDRAKPAYALWDDETPKVQALLTDYFNSTNRESVEEAFRNWETDKKPRGFPADIESIRRTLILLIDYEKDIIRFMSNWITEDPDFCSRLAFAMHTLSYGQTGALAQSRELRKRNQNKLTEDMESARDTFANPDKFNERYEAWKKNNRWHKRIWAALRDYKKSKPLCGVFISGIKDSTAERVWNGDFLAQLELPGDLWNDRFVKCCVYPLAEAMGVRTNLHAPELVRTLWDKTKAPDCYPEQFDISFHFTPRMCNFRLCDVCPLGPDGASAICVGDRRKQCTVALVTCGFVTKCTGGRDCLLRDHAKGTCRACKD